MRIRGALFFCIGLLILSLAVGCSTSNAGNNNPDGAVRLLVATINDSDEENRSQALLEYEFLNGELISTQTILTNPGGQLRFNCDESYLVQNRYVVTDFGDIVDIQSEEFIHYGGSGSDYTRLVSIEDDNVIIKTPNTGEYSYYNLSTQEYKELEDHRKWDLPGILSPDGNKSIFSSCGFFGDNQSILLYSLDGEEKVLGSGFSIWVSMFSSDSCVDIPMMWIDNNTIITQSANGKIVTVTTDGVVEPVVNISLKAEEDPNLSWLERGVLGGYFKTDSEGDIIYRLYYPSIPGYDFGPTSFVIDVTNKSYSIYNQDWTELGNGFEVENTADTDYSTIRYNGTNISQERFYQWETATTEGYLALIYHDEVSYAESIKVWSSTNEKWTTIDIESPIWLTRTSLIGWIQ